MVLSQNLKAATSHSEVEVASEILYNIALGLRMKERCGERQDLFNWRQGMDSTISWKEKSKYGWLRVVQASSNGLDWLHLICTVSWTVTCILERVIFFPSFPFPLVTHWRHDESLTDDRAPDRWPSPWPMTESLTDGLIITIKWRDPRHGSLRVDALVVSLETRRRDDTYYTIRVFKDRNCSTESLKLDFAPSNKIRVTSFITQRELPVLVHHRSSILLIELYPTERQLARCSAAEAFEPRTRLRGPSEP